MFVFICVGVDLVKNATRTTCLVFGTCTTTKATKTSAANSQKILHIAHIITFVTQYFVCKNLEKFVILPFIAALKIS